MADDASWQELYAAAMLELDRVHLQSRIDAAEIAIRQAMQELTDQSRGRRRGGTAGFVFRFGQPADTAKSGIQKTNFFRQRKPYSRRADVMKRVCRKIGTHDLAQTTVGDDGVASSCENRDGS